MSIRQVCTALTFGLAIGSTSLAFAQDDMGDDADMTEEGMEEEGMEEEGEPEEAAAEPAEAAPAGESAAAGTISASVDGAFVLPLGDWADIAGVGMGVMVRAGYQIQDKLQATARLGYIYHLAKDVGGVDIETSDVLILAGARYDLGPAAVDVATGFSILSVSAGGSDDSNNRIPLMIGASVPVAPVEIGASLLIPNLLLTEDNEDMQMGIMATVGYKFM